MVRQLDPPQTVANKEAAIAPHDPTSEQAAEDTRKGVAMSDSTQEVHMPMVPTRQQPQPVALQASEVGTPPLAVTGADMPIATTNAALVAPVTADSASGHDEQQVMEGDLLSLHGLLSRPTLNGSQAAALQFHPTKQRWAVQLLDTGEKLLLKRSNLTVLQRFSSLREMCENYCGSEDSEDDDAMMR